MDKLRKVISFTLKNRRIIGSIVGSLLMLYGYADEGAFISDMSKRL